MITFSVLQRLFEKMIGIGHVPIEILNISTICILNFIVDLHTDVLFLELRFHLS